MSIQVSSILSQIKLFSLKKKTNIEGDDGSYTALPVAASVTALHQGLVKENRLTRLQHCVIIFNNQYQY